MVVENVEIENPENNPTLIISVRPSVACFYQAALPAVPDRVAADDSPQMKETVDGSLFFVANECKPAKKLDSEG
jgi:hypothetical protein